MGGRFKKRCFQHKSSWRRERRDSRGGWSAGSSGGANYDKLATSSEHATTREALLTPNAQNTTTTNNNNTENNHSESEIKFQPEVPIPEVAKELNGIGNGVDPVLSTSRLLPGFLLAIFSICNRATGQFHLGPEWLSHIHSRSPNVSSTAIGTQEMEETPIDALNHMQPFHHHHHPIQLSTQLVQLPLMPTNHAHTTPQAIITQP